MLLAALLRVLVVVLSCASLWDLMGSISSWQGRFSYSHRFENTILLFKQGAAAVHRSTKNSAEGIVRE